MNESLLHQAFLAVLPTCLTLSGWKNRGEQVHTTQSRVELAWDVALTACAEHPTRKAQAHASDYVQEALAEMDRLALAKGPETALNFIRVVLGKMPMPTQADIDEAAKSVHSESTETEKK